MKLMQAIVELLTKEDRDRDKYEVRGYGYAFWYSFRRDAIVGRHPAVRPNPAHPFEYFFSGANEWCRLHEMLEHDNWGITRKENKPKVEPKRGIVLEEGWQLVGFHMPASFYVPDISHYTILKFKRKDGVFENVYVPIDRAIKEVDF